MVYRIVPAVGKHIVAQDPLSGACVGIRVQESASCGIVISGLQIIEPGLYITTVAMIPKTRSLLTTLRSTKDEVFFI